MTSYHLVLFVHLLALVAASAASGIVHVAEVRYRRATRVDDARFWHGLASHTARIFPIALVALVATGSWMMHSGGWAWSSGWVVAGLLTTVFLFASGGLLGARGAAEARALRALDRDAAWSPAPGAAGFERALSWSNTGVAMAAVYVMVIKPALAGALVALVVGAALGVTVSATSRA